MIDLPADPRLKMRGIAIALHGHRDLRRRHVPGRGDFAEQRDQGLAAFRALDEKRGTMWRKSQAWPALVPLTQCSAAPAMRCSSRGPWLLRWLLSAI